MACMPRAIEILSLSLLLCCQSQDADARPLAHPTFKIEGTEATSFTAKLVERKDDALHFEGKITLTMSLPKKLPIDLVPGREIQVLYRKTQGFEGSATGLVLRDADGIILAADDGAYGNALKPAEIEPFKVTQRDAGFRNRKNTPDDLNNFWLVAASGKSEVKLIHGQSAELKSGERLYTVLAVKSTSRVGDVRWTDAPYEYKAFVIARKP